MNAEKLFDKSLKIRRKFYCQLKVLSYDILQRNIDDGDKPYRSFDINGITNYYQTYLDILLY